MNTRQLQYVLMVAEERSFSAAAKRLYVAQPSLSEFIRKVEKELGYELFDRTVNPLKLTVAGEAYIETAREILNLERALENRLRDMDEDQYGRLAVGVSPYSSVAPLILERFFRVFPNYVVDVQDSVGTLERLKLLEQGKLDLCIQPISDAIGSKFVAEEIMLDELLLVVPADHPINDELVCRNDESSPYPIIDLSMLGRLKDMPFIMVDDIKHLRRSVYRLFDQVGLDPNIKVICHKSEGCLDMAVSGIGATIVQFSLVKYKEVQHAVKCYMIDQNVMKNKIAAVYVRNRYISKAARTFIDILKQI